MIINFKAYVHGDPGEFRYPPNDVRPDDFWTPSKNGYPGISQNKAGASYPGKYPTLSSRNSLEGVCYILEM